MPTNRFVLSPASATRSIPSYFTKPDYDVWTFPLDIPKSWTSLDGLTYSGPKPHGVALNRTSKMSFIELCKGGRLDEAKALFENVEMLELYSRYGRQQCLVDGQALKCQAEVEEIFHTVKNLRGELSAELEIIHHLEE